MSSSSSSSKLQRRRRRYSTRQQLSSPSTATTTTTTTTTTTLVRKRQEQEQPQQQQQRQNATRLSSSESKLPPRKRRKTITPAASAAAAIAERKKQAAAAANNNEKKNIAMNVNVMPVLSEASERLVTALLDACEAAGDPERARGNAKYVHNQFVFFGITAKQRDAIIKQHHTKNDDDDDDAAAAAYVPFKDEAQLTGAVHRMLRASEARGREAAARAIHPSRKRYNASLPRAGTLPVWEAHVRSAYAWWDTVDIVASNIIGGNMWWRNPGAMESLMSTWIADASCMWIRRCALLCFLKHKARTNWPLLQRHICAVMHEDDFFIQKAIGWVLREYSKTNRRAVKTFIATHAAQLSNLSRREGLKHIDKTTTTT
jgi:3-methyladenine DNA glycosylase AlkD